MIISGIIAVIIGFIVVGALIESSEEKYK